MRKVRYTVYSFENIIASFSCDNVGAHSSVGAGVGSINVAMANDKTIHEVDACGNVFVLKVPGNNGNLALTLQQTSPLHNWLLYKWFNYINSPGTPASYWAAMNITIYDIYTGDTIRLTGVSPQKLPDRPYQAAGSTITWNLMAREITEE